MKNWKMAGLLLGVLCASGQAHAGQASASQESVPTVQEKVKTNGLLPPKAQEQVKEVVEMRVKSTGGGSLVGVDRGQVDGLKKGDRVRFFPPEGAPINGRVETVFERVSMVMVAAGERIPALGTLGRAMIPVKRFGESEEERDEEPPLHLPWEVEDDDWTPDKPLLTPMEVVNPNARVPMISARVVLQGFLTETNSLRSDSFYRAGVDWEGENLFGNGGTIKFDAELNKSDVNLQDGDAEESSRLRIDRLSYVLGGTRFSPLRLESGRFLQHGMPEFGVLDGVEWSKRQSDGTSYGFSAGYQPAPDPDYRSGNDFQVAGYYRWVRDVDERLVASAGFQKSFHNGAGDRDLLVGSLAYLPDEGWNAHVNAWFDLYGSNETARNAGIGLTRLIADTDREFQDGSNLRLALLHQEFADIDRFEGIAPSVAELASRRSDRLSARLQRGWRDQRRWYAGAGLWNDQDDTGGDVELGFEQLDWVLDASRANWTAFGVLGKFSTIVGIRGTYALRRPEGTWTALAEFSDRFLDGFDADQDEILQHRLRGSFDAQLGSGWQLSLYGEGRSFDDALAASIGFYLQRYY